MTLNENVTLEEVEVYLLQTDRNILAPWLPNHPGQFRAGEGRPASELKGGVE